MQRDVKVWTASTLAGAWSAISITSDLSTDLLEQLHDVFGELDPLVRVRALLACALLPRNRLRELERPVRRLLERAAQDDSEWVRLYGHAIDVDQGLVRLDKALEKFPGIKTTLEKLTEQLEDVDVSSIPPSLRPIEEDFLSDRLLSQHAAQVRQPGPGSSHFTVRPSGRAHERLLQGNRPSLASIVSNAAACDDNSYKALLAGVASVGPARTTKRTPADLFMKRPYLHVKAPAGKAATSGAHASPLATVASMQAHGGRAADLFGEPSVKRPMTALATDTALAAPLPSALSAPVQLPLVAQSSLEPPKGYGGQDAGDGKAEELEEAPEENKNEQEEEDDDRLAPDLF